MTVQFMSTLTDGPRRERLIGNAKLLVQDVTTRNRLKRRNLFLSDVAE